MIIDVHTHLAFQGVYPREFIAELLGGEGEGPALSSLARRWLSDQSGDRLVAEMDRAGIARSVVLMIDGGLRYGEDEGWLEQSYAVHRLLLQRWPNRFIVFGGVDPRRGPAALHLFRRSVVEWGFRGMKLYPPMGFSPADRSLDPYLDICAEHELPVMIHSGDSLRSLSNELAHPDGVRALARRRPEITIIMAHGGYSLADTSVRRAMECPNVMVDVAGFQAFEAAEDLAWIFRPEFNQRVLFGSDYPLFHFSRGIAQDVQRIRAVFEAAEGMDARDLAESGDQRLENILWRNAQRVLDRLSVVTRTGGQAS